MNNTKIGLLETHNTKLYYEIAGEGHPLVLIHGFSLDTRMWDNHFKTLAQDYQVIRYDMRGFGKSELPTTGHYTHIDDLKELLNHLKISQAYVLGLSKGGRVAINFTITYPDMVTALIGVSLIPSGFIRMEESPSLSEPLFFEAKRNGISSAKKLWLNHPLFSSSMKKENVKNNLQDIVHNYSGWHWLNVDPDLNFEFPAAQYVDTINKPTLIIVGEHDLIDYQRAAIYLKNKIPNSQMVSIPETGHMVNMENPEIFNELVLNFLH